MRYIISLLILSICTPLFAANTLVYIPPDNRQHNKGPSCGFASLTTALRAAGLWKEADEFWSKYRGPANIGNVSARLEKSNIDFKIIKGGDEKAMIEALDSGRMVCVTWGGRHMVDLIGKINGKAYLVDNNSPKKYKVRTWKDFMSSHKRSGGWGVIILSGQVAQPVEQMDLSGFEE